MSKKALKPLVLTATLVATLTLAACGGDSGGDNADGDSTTPSGDCTPAAEFETINAGKLTIAGVQQLPGLNVDPVSGEVTGLDSVLLVGFAKANCLEADFQPLAGPAAVAALTEGKADVGGGGWYRTEARGEVMGQTDPIWYDQLAAFAKTEITSIDQLKDLKVGIVGGSVFEGPLTEAIGADHVTPYQSIDAIFEDVGAGRVDAGLGAGATTTIQVNERDLDLVVSIIAPDPNFEALTAPGEPNYPFTKTNTALGEALNAYVQAAREDGTVERVLAEFGVTGDVALNGPQQ